MFDNNLHPVFYLSRRARSRNDRAQVGTNRQLQHGQRRPARRTALYHGPLHREGRGADSHPLAREDTGPARHHREFHLARASSKPGALPLDETVEYGQEHPGRLCRPPGRCRLRGLLTCSPTKRRYVNGTNIHLSGAGASKRDCGLRLTLTVTSAFGLRFRRCPSDSIPTLIPIANLEGESAIRSPQSAIRVRPADDAAG